MDKHPIGGYFEFELFHGNAWHESAYAVNSARSALCLILAARGYRKVHIPSFMCSCIRETLDRYAIAWEVYPVDEEWYPAFERTLLDDEAVLIANYFGQLSNQDVLKLKQRYRNIILDNVQSFFQMPPTGVDTIYSTRKYFGVTDGGYAYTECDAAQKIYQEFEQDYSYGRLEHLVGRMEKTPEEFYSQNLRNEQMIDESPNCKMSAFTANVLRSIDYNRVCEQRARNFLILHSELAKYNRLEIKNQAGLFMYPLLCDDLKLRQHLINHRIFVPKLWPKISIDAADDARETYLTNHIVWLPIDQRYSEADMERIIKRTKECLD